MRLFLDTEFNGFGGELISLALVAEDGCEWYGVLPLPAKIDKWVAEHVIPFLDIDSKYALYDEPAFQASLAKFLSQFPDVEIIADWPADFEHLCSMLSYEAGFRISINCTMRLVRIPGIKPEIPHNALSDARALKEAYLKSYRKPELTQEQLEELW